MIERIEQSICEILKTKFPKFDIRVYHSDFKKYNFTNSTGCMLICYKGVQYSEQKTIGDIYQEGLYTYTIKAGFKSCNEMSDCYSDLEELKLIIDGIKINSRYTYLSECKFEEEYCNDLWWNITVKIKLPIFKEIK